MRFPMSTGAVASVLGTTEPKLAEEVRRGRVTPAPQIFAGRRLWQREHVLQAARRLGLLNDELRERLAEEVPDAL